jgi:hypothetical protein
MAVEGFVWGSGCGGGPLASYQLTMLEKDISAFLEGV